MQMKNKKSFNDTDCAVMFITGQSNAHAHNQFMDEEDFIKEPLKNVFSLDRKDNGRFDLTSLVWSGYTSYGKNLGEIQDCTFSMAHYVASKWQKRIDDGEKLPDLYIVQISIGSQGIVNGMWNRERKFTFLQSTLRNIDMSLYPWGKKIFGMVESSLKLLNKNPICIGWHWIGSEQDTVGDTALMPNFYEKYVDFFDTMKYAIGMDCPLYLYKLVCDMVDGKNQRKAQIDAVNNCFEKLTCRYDNCKIVKTDESPLWDENADNNGVFDYDNIHYLEQTQEWFADSFLFEIYQKYCK